MGDLDIFHVVDKANGCLTTIDGDTSNDMGGFVPRADVGQGVAVYNTIVLNLKSLNSVYLVNDIIVNLGNGGCIDHANTLLEDTIDVGSYLALLVRKQRVTTASGKTAFLANDRTWHYLDAELQVVNHATNDGNLLEILLAKVCTVGIDIAKQLAYNLANPIEVAWTERTLHDTICGRIAKLTCVGFGIDLLDRGCEGYCCPMLLKQAAIGL